jgi:RND family efflux transporter MFP subunit
MHESPRRFALPGCASASLLACLAVAAAEPELRLTAAQLATAGVTFSPAIRPAAEAGASLQLAGRVVVPNAGLEQVLAPVPGRIEALLVDPGQTVRTGQPLLRLYSADFLAMQRALVGARARWQAASARAGRDEALHAEGIIARNRLEESRAQLVEAEAQLGEQRQLLRIAGLPDAAIAALRTAADIQPLLTLAARRDGSVLQQLASPGAAVEAGAPLLRIARLDKLWIELQATRDQALRIRNGDSATVAGCARAGKVIAAALQLEERSQTVTVRVELPQTDGCVAPNQFIEARLAPRAGGAGLVQVPAASLAQHQGRTYVFVRSPGGVAPRQVEVERRSPTAAWISGGVQAGDQVASSGLAAIKGSWLGLGAASSEAP